MLRRQLLHFGAFTLGGLPVSLVHAQNGGQKKLVVVMLRGAVDGLSVVAPYGEREYAASRPQIALPPPGTDDGLLKLDALFGLHPALSPLKRHWDGGQLAFVHASGSPDPTRSHFDAQDYFESGTPGRKSTPDGWMNRLLTALPGEPSPTRAISQGQTPPRIFAGTASVASLGLGPGAMQRRAIDNPQMQAGLAKLYANDAQLSGTLRDATEGRGEMARSMAAGEPRSMDPSADAGAPSARSFAADARRLGTLIRKDPHTQLAFTSVGGWDTHVNQGAARGQLANRLASLGEGLDALVRGPGRHLQGHRHRRRQRVRPHAAPERQRRHRPWPRQRHLAAGRPRGRRAGAGRMAGAGCQRARRRPRPGRAHRLPPGARAAAAAPPGPVGDRAGDSVSREPANLALCQPAAARLRRLPPRSNGWENDMMRTNSLFSLCLSLAVLAYCFLVANGA